MASWLSKQIEQKFTYVIDPNQPFKKRCTDTILKD